MSPSNIVTGHRHPAGTPEYEEMLAQAREQIMTRDEMTITVDRKPYTTSGGRYVGLAIKQLAGVPRTNQLWLEVEGNSEDRLVMDQDAIDLQDGQIFYSQPEHITAG